MHGQPFVTGSGDPIQSRNLCPARYCPCYRCGKRGHFAKICKKQASSVRGRFLAVTLTSENLSPKKFILPTFLQVLLVDLVLQLFNQHL